MYVARAFRANATMAGRPAIFRRRRANAVTVKARLRAKRQHARAF
jgi:hypothetical protein